MMTVRGRVAAVLGDNVDTDVIYPGRYLNITDREKTAEHLFELAFPRMREKLQSGEIIVAGKNFGCGSSREQATAALKYAGVGAVIAGSFARIFYRNSINLGLPAVVADLTERVAVGDELEIDLTGGHVRNLSRSEDAESAALDPRAVELLAAGGLIPYLKEKHHV
jgi:3-isopropylmalate/(R)-2-methylmalate dehydratase small subunit